MTANERLAEIKARAEAATEGPWRAMPDRERRLYAIDSDQDYITLHDTVTIDDATFIAHARTDVPQLVAALEAVLELHKPVGVEPCDTICGECSYRLPNGRYMPTVEHPCPTVTAINEALGGTS